MPYLTVSIAQKMPKIQQMSLSTTRCLPATFGGRRVSWQSVICSIFCKLEISSRYYKGFRNNPSIVTLLACGTPSGTAGCSRWTSVMKARNSADPNESDEAVFVSCRSLSCHCGYLQRYKTTNFKVVAVVSIPAPKISPCRK